MPTYTCRTEGMSLGRSLRKAVDHQNEHPTHRVVERKLVERLLAEVFR